MGVHQNVHQISNAVWLEAPASFGEPSRASLQGEMDFEGVVKTLDKLLLRKHPKSFNSSWILRNAPRCYRFISTKVRTEVGGIDWDRVTRALDWKHQRLWAPERRRATRKLYRDMNEIAPVLNKYRDKLYVFIAPHSAGDRRVRDIAAVALVRVAQNGNLSSKEEVLKLVRYTIDEWIDRYPYIYRWKGHDDEIRTQLEGCIRRYRYSGSFFTYVLRTLEYAGRGIRPFFAYSLDEPVAADAQRRKIEDVVWNRETNEMRLCRR